MPYPAQPAAPVNRSIQICTAPPASNTINHYNKIISHCTSKTPGKGDLAVLERLMAARIHFQRSTGSEKEGQHPGRCCPAQVIGKEGCQLPEGGGKVTMPDAREPHSLISTSARSNKI
jgi:hypothetical protein